MCGYFRIESAPKSMFKVILPQKQYDTRLDELVSKVVWVYMGVIFFIGVFAFAFALYALYPLRKALHLMEDFLKDVIHDLNTPVTSMLLNIKSLLKKSPSQELERIELGARTIASLYQNLEVLHKGFIPQNTAIDLHAFLPLRIKPFEKLYPSLRFTLQTQPFVIHADPDALVRIVDNIVSNACKYNSKGGSVNVRNEGNVVFIEDSGVGIKRCDLVFERYYKEGSRGLGLGLHIVKSLCDAMRIGIEISSKEGAGTCVILRFLVEAKQ
jgi:two-component system, OmpR family, sensor kinase